VPAEVPLKVYKCYSSRYGAIQKTLPLAKIEQDPIVLKQP
jgi:hypothetical protein